MHNLSFESFYDEFNVLFLFKRHDDIKTLIGKVYTKISTIQNPPAVYLYFSTDPYTGLYPPNGYQPLKQIESKQQLELLGRKKMVRTS